MAVYEPKAIRNLALVGHRGNGKTSLAEAMLFVAGAIDRVGKVEDGTTTTDYDPEETKRHISISAAIAPAEYNGSKINIIDVPGYFDFAGEMVQAMAVADSVLVVMSATSGLKVGTEKGLIQAAKAKMSRMVFVNKLDRENAKFDKCMEQLKDFLGNKAIPFMVPIMNGMVMEGYVDLIVNKAYKFEKNSVAEIAIPQELEASAQSYRKAMIEAAAENDEALLDKFFSGEELSIDEIKLGLKKGVAAGSVVPVMAGSAGECWAINKLLDAIVEFLPPAADREGVVAKSTKDDKEVVRNFDPAQPFSARVFKTVADPFVGKLSIMKVISGALTSDMTLYNPNVDKSEKTGTIYIMKGKKQSSIDKVYAGDICALAKLQYTQTGHTLCVADDAVIYPTFNMPKPVVSMAVAPKNQGDEDKVFSGLHRLEEEDLTFTVAKQVDTGEMLISGLGELHLEVITKKLSNKFNVSVVLTQPKIPYRETIRKPVKAEGKHKKQSGGHGQYGHCVIEFEPITDSDVEFEFVDKIVGGVVPRQYIPAVEKGLRESITKGVLAGYPVVGLRATLVFGSYHDVDSSEMAFKIAAHMAFKSGCKEATPILLEPIYRVEVTVPEDYTGDIMGDFNRRRGRILGMEPCEDGQRVIAEAPLAEMFTYATDLRSMTQARGSFDMTFERYEDVPGNISAKIIEDAVKDDSDD